MSIKTNAALAEPWRDLWNNDLSLTDKIVAPGLVSHAAPITGSGSDVKHGREALNQWVAGIHTVFTGLRFAITVGPVADEDHLVLR